MFNIDQTTVRVILILLLFIVLPAGVCATPPSIYPTVTISWSDLKEILDERPFKSQEELLQLLHLLHGQKAKGKSLRIEGDTVVKMKKELNSLFPLDKCTSIVLQPSTVIMNFSESQDVALPRTWRQASIEVPDKLVLQISEDGPISGQEQKEETAASADPQKIIESKSLTTVRFKISQGYVKIHFSFLLRLFGGRLRDANGSEIIYQIDSTRKVSRLSLLEVNVLSKDNFVPVETAQSDSSADYQWIDILHPDFPSEKDIGFNDHQISYLGFEVNLLADGVIQLDEGPPQQDQKMYDHFKGLIDHYKQFSQSGMSFRKIDYVRSFSYHFEEKHMEISMGLQEKKQMN